ncbi:MAG: riboflavin kinase, partial [Planctomycetota bacterium]
VVQAVGFEGEVASSTAVRAYLRDGDLAAAERLLGRRPSLAGKVVSGDQRGRKIGFPTANIAHEGTLVPAHGVYAAWVDVLDDHGAKKTTHAAMANIGRRPTFDGEAVSIEAFLIDFEGDLYGRRLRAHLVRRLRSEQKFSGIDALTAQLHRDCAAARAALESS